MAYEEDINQLIAELNAAHKSLTYWHSQPDLQVEGFSKTAHIELIETNIRRVENAIAVLGRANA